MQCCGPLLREAITPFSAGYFGRDRSVQTQENGGLENFSWAASERILKIGGLEQTGLQWRRSSCSGCSWCVRLSHPIVSNYLCISTLVHARGKASSCNQSPVLHRCFTSSKESFDRVFGREVYLQFISETIQSGTDLTGYMLFRLNHFLAEQFMLFFSFF